MYTLFTGHDYFAYHKNQAFTTRDQDNDSHATINCAVLHHGAWWYKDCFDTNLNADYRSSGSTGVCLYDTVNRYQCSFQYTEMKIRPKQMSR